MDGWGALKMLMNRQQGNQQRKKKLKNARDKKLTSNVYSKTKFNFPTASKTLLESMVRKLKETKKENC
ncbi:hypothetical protein [uncultured Tenacibaculum sp.]|uniref:hypothetical protein n=1 Tax=uncultured Tenacibaculum sp. TaxID=174713 RepID=UPI002639FD57|nr:hypothetical protein [uncultured Tenacibaculum sp.]